jgi:glycosyltransferase involved in cell wall biosynthesis
VTAVEIVVPAYNEAGRIGPTIAPLADRYAVLVVDDGSTDDTAMEARNLAASRGPTADSFSTFSDICCAAKR